MDKNKIDDEGNIFIRLATDKEKYSPTAKNKAINSFPEKEGYDIVYMSYGYFGRGFYYRKESLNKFKNKWAFEGISVEKLFQKIVESTHFAFFNEAK